MKPQENNNLHISGFDSSISENDLRRHFEQYGSIRSTKIMSYPSHLTGFVAFLEPSDAERALAALDGSTLKGQSITVVWAKKPPSGRRNNAREDNLSESPPSSLTRVSQVPKALTEVRAPSDERTRCVIHLVAKLVAEYGSAMEQAAIQLAASNKSLQFLDKEHIFFDYYVINVIHQAYALHDVRSPAIIHMPDGRTIHYKFSDGAQPGLETLEDASIRQTNAEAAADFEALRVLLATFANVSLNLPSPYTVDVVNFFNTLPTLERLSYSIKPVSMVALNLNTAEIARGIINYLIQTESLENKMALTYLINDILCNVTCDASLPGRMKTVFQKKLPTVFAHWRKICNRYIESGRSCVSISKRIYLILYVWRACAVFSQDYLDGLELAFLPHQSEPNWLKAPKALVLSDVQELNGSPLSGEFTRALSGLPVALRREFYNVYKLRDDIWSLRALCEKNGLPYTATDHRVRLMQLLLMRMAYSMSRSRMELPHAPDTCLDPNTILATRSRLP